jgi:predicted transcriptional regulator
MGVGGPDCGVTDRVVRELAFYVKVQRGLADSDAGRTVSNEDMQLRIRSWQK